MLEPFANELQLGDDAGQSEVDALTHAGFRVDVLRNDQVTVAALMHLSQYSVVYWDTHANTLENGDAVVMTGETDTKPYSAYYGDHTLIQAYVAGDHSKTLYNGITGDFIARHMDSFAPGAILFVNGCATLNAPLFWQHLQSRGISALISWDGEAQSAGNERAAGYVLHLLESGESVDAATGEARTEGLGLSIVNGVVARLGFEGWGGETLTDALTGGTQSAATVTSAATDTPTATATPLPTATPKPANHRKGSCRPGHHRVHGKCTPTHRRKKP